jgi:hypothetical protein
MQQEGGSALGDDSGLGVHEWGSWPDLQVDSTVGPPHLTNKSRISNTGCNFRVAGDWRPYLTWRMRWRWAGAAEQNLVQPAWDSVLQSTSFLISWPAARKSLGLAAILGDFCRSYRPAYMKLQYWTREGVFCRIRRNPASGVKLALWTLFAFLRGPSTEAC